MTGHSAVTVSNAIADTLTRPAALRTTTPTTTDQAWPQGLANGAAGIALLHIERALCGDADWDIAHIWLRYATAEPVTAARNASLYCGAPTLAFVTRAASMSGRYRRAATALHDATVALTEARVAEAHTRMDRADRPTLAEFDLVRGITGLGACHLQHTPDAPATRAILACLVRMATGSPSSDGLPPWWVSIGPNGTVDPAYRGGHGNLGAAHGISAPLALLSLSVLSGAAVPGTEDAIARICAWTDAWCHTADDEPWWPGLLTVDQHQTQRVAPGLRPKPSWCYGVAGTARAQQLAGIALDDATRVRRAEDAMLAVLRNRAQVDRVASEIGLCHGLAGLLQSACRMNADKPCDELSGYISDLAARLVAAVETPELHTGPGLLDGAAGAALALRTAGTGRMPTSGWDRALLLA